MKKYYIALIMFFLHTWLPMSHTRAEDSNSSANNKPYMRNAMILIENEIRMWCQTTAIQEALLEHNKRTGDMLTAEIQSLNAMWRSELKKAQKNMIRRVLNHPLSTYFRSIKERSQGLYTEIILLDAQGLAVAMTDITDSYSYVDAPFWKRTMSMGSVLPYVGDIEFSDNTMLFQAPAAVPIMQDEKIIGVLYAGIDVDILNERY